MNIRLSAPSKTFLIGEYAVLAGGPALIINSNPRFTFTAVQGATAVNGIPAGSPASRWIEQRQPLLENWQLDFSDPHEGKGGFGASSAQFLFVHALSTLLQISVSRAVAGLDLKALWNDFKVLSEGSGADVLAQAAGQVALVGAGSAEAKAWPFPDLDFAILRTGHKVQTHEHLRELEAEKPRDLVGPSHQAVENFISGNADKFIQSVKLFSQKLRELHLQAPATLRLLNEFEQQSWCRAAKGCGALGADTILLLFDRSEADAAHAKIREMGFEIAATRKDLSGGLQMEWSWNES